MEIHAKVVRAEGGGRCTLNVCALTRFGAAVLARPGEAGQEHATVQRHGRRVAGAVYACRGRVSGRQRAKVRSASSHGDFTSGTDHTFSEKAN